MTHDERLQETYRRFPHLRHTKKPDTDEVMNMHYELQEVPVIADELKVCPNCGAKFLRLDGGCASCLSCGWSACGR